MFSTSTSKPDAELTILERIRQAEHDEGHVTQRELARASGLSLGMTNSLVKRFSEQGWIELARHSSKSVRYIVTPQGAAELARRVEASYKDASRNATRYRARIELFIGEVVKSGASALVFCGSSEMSPLFEELCEKLGLAFLRCADLERAAGFGRKPGFVLVSATAEGLEGAVSLSAILSR